MSNNSLLHPFQSTYRSNHSTENGFLHNVSCLLLVSESGKVSLLTLLDLSAAFDTIDRSILLSRVELDLSRICATGSKQRPLTTSDLIL